MKLTIETIEGTPDECRTLLEMHFRDEIERQFKELIERETKK